ncbi:MAG: flagellar FlbD family protein [Endomicrobia bacterium]|nr:flagellar FlbD family protein [Endomicrobiia bacterium]
MIKLHRLNGVEIVINAELVESIESIPDTKIILTNGNQFVVKETPEEIMNKIINYKAEIEIEKEKRKKLGG